MRELKDLNKFDFRPLGGSFVTFTPFWSTVIGKWSQGIEVKKSLNSSRISFFGSYQDSIILSSSGIQLLAKLQFYKITHSPFLIPFSIAFSALFPIPDPKLKISGLAFISIYNLSIKLIGSAP